MISIQRPTEETHCQSCGRKDDIYRIVVGRDVKTTLSFYLCPSCRKQLSGMLGKRIK